MHHTQTEIRLRCGWARHLIGDSPGHECSYVDAPDGFFTPQRRGRF